MLKKTKLEKTFSILNEYNGNNQYILDLKKSGDITDFQMDYVLKNYNFNEKIINKIVKISDWYGEDRRKNLNLDFIPDKMLIHKLIGETDNYYHCLVQYRKSISPSYSFIPKRAILTNFLCENYEDLQIDFTWFDKKLKQINENYYVLDHQKDSVKFLLSRKKCILSLDMGLGKTLSSIIASLMYGFKKVLVICPASIKTNWKNELERFVDSDNISIIKGFNEMNKDELLKFLNIKDEKKYKVEELRKIAKENGKWNEGKQFTILNFDIIDEFHKNNRSKKENDSELLKSDFDIVIIDEAHKLSNNTSNRYKIIKNFLKKAKNEYTWLLTGTMITNNVKNLYNMLSLIENNITSDYKFFMERYCNAKKILRKGEWDRCWNQWNKTRHYESYNSMPNTSKVMFREYIDKYGKHVMIDSGSSNLEELSERIRHIYFRKTKDELMSIKKIIVPVVYQLTEEQQNTYNDLWNKYEEEKNKEGKDVNEIKQLIEVTINRQYISKIMVEKTIKLTEKLLSKDKKVFIVCCYDEELYKLKDYFGDKCVIYNGKMSSKQKDKSIEEFNNNENIKIIIGQIEAIGTGVNLNKSCNHCIFQNLDFTEASFSQACDRIFRIGSKEDCYIYLQYFKNTVYEHIVNIINKKKEISQKLINTN